MMGWRLGCGLCGLALCALVACEEDTGGGDDDDGSGGTTSSSTSGSGGNTSTSSTSSSTSSGTGGTTGCESGPLALPLPGCQPTPPASTGNFYQDCVDRINQFRWECQCLPPLQRWTEAEACTDQQSADDQASGVGHDNFGACGENAQNTCPDWGSDQQIIGGCLQMMWDEGPGEPFIDHGHYINMSSTSYTKVACGSSTASGGVWSNQNFSQ
jgi:hypothetical protein